MVGGDQNDPVLALCQFRQARGADGICKGFLYQLGFGFACDIFIGLGSDNGFQIFLSNVKIQRGGVIRNFDRFHTNPPF